MSVIPATEGSPAWAKSKTISKITRAKRAGGLAQEVECLPSKCKALISNPSTAKIILNKGK
jgi:hypothetical protein